MRVGILGSGLMGGKLGTIFARAGHEVVFSYARSTTNSRGWRVTLRATHAPVRRPRLRVSSPSRETDCPMIVSGRSNKHE